MKNKGLKITLIVLLSIVPLALIAVMIFAILNKSLDLKVSLIKFGDNTEMIFQNEYDPEQFENINIDASSSNVRIEKGNTDKIKVTAYGDKDDRIAENISENDIAAVHDRLFDRVGWLIDKYEWDSTVDRISQIYANKEVQIKNYDVQQYALNKEAENRCRELLKKGGAASITVIIENNNSIVLHLKA